MGINLFPQIPLGNGYVMQLQGGGFAIGVLLLVGFIHAIIATVFALVAAAAATIVLIVMAKGLGWQFNLRPKGLFNVLTSGFIAYTVVTWIVDFAAQTYFSTPMMVVALDRLACHPNCGLVGDILSVPPAINSIGGYYAYATGGNTAPDWERYLLLQFPGLAALALVLLLAKDEDFQTPKGRVVDIPVLGPTQAIRDFHLFRSPAGLARLAIASAAALAVALVVAFPMVVTLMIGLRDMGRAAGG